MLRGEEGRGQIERQRCRQKSRLQMQQSFFFFGRGGGGERGALLRVGGAAGVGGYDVVKKCEPSRRMQAACAE